MAATAAPDPLLASEQRGACVLLKGIRGPLGCRPAQPPGLLPISSTPLPFQRNFTVVVKPMPLG
jgi:hypothetical protein